MKFPERLKCLRKEAGLTQAAIAKELQVGQNSYSNWEKGNRTPIRPTIERLAEVLNTSADYLLGETDEPHVKKEVTIFSERLKALRLEAKLTQSDVAKEFGISQQAYAKWENAKANPTQSVITKLANFYNVSIDYLMGKSDYKNSDEIDLSTFEILYRKTSKNLSDEDKKILEEDLKEFLLEREKAIKAMQSKE